MKHPSGVDLEKLDLEELDKEMAADKAAQSSATETDAPENAPNTDGAVADTWTYHLEKRISFLCFFFFFCFFLVPIMFEGFL